LDNQEGAPEAQQPTQPSKPTRVSRAINEIKSYHERRRAEKSKYSPSDRAALSTARATWFIAVLTLVAAGAAISQYVIFDKQLSAMKEEFSFAHRPHMRLRFTRIQHEGEKFFKAGKLVNGTIDVLNNGQTNAEITGSDIEVSWTNKRLPDCFPKYCDGKMKPNNFVCLERPCTIAAGDRISAKFQSAEPMPDSADQIENGSNGWKLYLLGWIQYRGRLDTNTRNFDFALVFDPKTHRFFPVTDDPDYSYDPDKS
jgi:hypothetical protein